MSVNHMQTSAFGGTRGHCILEMESQIVGDPHHGDTGNQALPLEERSVILVLGHGVFGVPGSLSDLAPPFGV